MGSNGLQADRSSGSSTVSIGRQLFTLTYSDFIKKIIMFYDKKIPNEYDIKESWANNQKRPPSSK